MPRYELDGDAWQIEQIGKQLEITSGGETRVRTFVTAEQAAAQLAKLIEERTGAGYVATPRDPRHPALEHAIAEDPEQPDGYLVFADWLQRQGDPRGQIMASAIAAEQRGEDDRAFQRDLKKHVHDLLGPLAPLDDPRPDDRARDLGVFAWRFGVIHGAYLHAEHQKPIDGALDQILDHASGRFLVELTMVYDERLQHAIDLLARRAPASLRALRVWQASSTRLGALWSALPRLRRVTLIGHALALGRLELPDLESFDLVDSQMPAASARALVTAPFPRLAQLRLDFGSGYTTGDASIDDVFDVLARRDLASLRQLALVRTRYIREVVLELGQSPLAGQLEKVDLSHNQMVDANAIELARQRARFPRLAHLDVTGNRLTSRGLAALAEAFPTVRSAHQEP